MSTKSTRSSGTQFNSRGVTQGNTLIGQKSGLPIDEVVDSNGVRRLAVDAALTLDTVTVNIDDLTPDKDQVSIGDKASGNDLKIEADGSLNANVEVDAADGDNIAISDGTNTLKINPDGSVTTNSKPLMGPSLQTTISVNSSIVKLVKVGISALVTRQIVVIQPIDGKIYAYFGSGGGAPSAATVIADGILIFKKAKESFEASASQDIYILALTGTVAVKVVERS